MKTIQEKLEEALSKVNDKPTKIVATGRTDKGVHALGQVFHFDTTLNISADGVKKGLNALLEKDIYIKSVTCVDEDFHARYSAKEKVYEYKINMSEYNPLEANYVCQLNKSLDIESMKSAAKLFVGEHDFYNFCGYQEQREKNYVRTISDIKIVVENNYLRVIIRGNGFIRYMVRMIVAILVEIGLKRKDENFIKERLDSKERKRSNYKISGCGLYLVEIFY